MSVLVVPVHKFDHLIGEPSAPVKLVQYGDFECGKCGEAYGVIRAVEAVHAGLVCSVFRHFPLGGPAHQWAQHAAEAAESAGVQGKFWEMHDMLFAHQHALAPPFLRHYAELIGLDMHEFDTDLTTHRLADQVRADKQSGVMSGVARTPTLFVNGLIFDGELDFGSLSRAIFAAAEGAVQTA
jgi:protein-disulfide isomerase